MKNKLILVILLCLLTFVSVVNAETITGTLGSSTGGTLTHTTGESYQPAAPSWLMVNEIQYAGFTNSIVLFDTKHAACQFDAGAPAGLSIPVTLRYPDSNGYPVGSGYIGYQRLWEGVTEIEGYQYITFNSWNISTMTGDVALYLDYNHTELYNMAKAGAGSSYESMPNGGMAWAHVATVLRPQTGIYLQSVTYTFYNNYTASKPSGLGITGTIYKEVDGTHYGSKAYIVNATSNVPITSQSTITSDDLTFNTNAQSIYIAIYTAAGQWVNSSTLFQVVTPTPTPTPFTNPYSIELSSDYSNYGDAVTGTLLYNGVAATASNTRAVDWVYRDSSLAEDTNGEYTNNINYVEDGNTTKHLNYGWNGSQFVGWDDANGGGFTNAKGASLPNALNLYTLLSGSVTVQCMVYPVGTGAPYKVTHPLTVGGTGSMYNIVIHAVDWQTGSIIGGSTISVQEKLTNTWSNVTTDDSGYRRVSYPSGTPLRIEASASGYVSDYLNYQVFGNDFVNIQLYRVGTEETNSSLSTLLVRTFERNDLGQIQPLSGVTVSLSDGQVKTTSAGTAQFTVANNTPVSIDAFKTGYVSATKRVTPTTSLTTATLYLYSTSSTHVPTPFPTATPTTRPTEATHGNLTTCQATLPAGSDIFDDIQNKIACWGIDDLEGQNLTMAVLIILLCAMILGKFGKGDGAAIGAIIGFVISFARHLIPFYLLVLAFALISAYFAKKFMGDK